MKHFTDLNVSNPQLFDKALSLGFQKTYSLTVASLPSKNSGGDVVQGPSDLVISACKQNRPFQFINPLLDREFYKNASLLAAAREKGKVFEIPILFLLRDRDRSRLMFQLRIFLKNCLKRKVPFVFTSRAASEFELKSPREIIAIGQCLGLLSNKPPQRFRHKWNKTKKGKKTK